jgi:hypothetical protein
MEPESSFFDPSKVLPSKYPLLVVNGKYIPADTPPRLINGRVFLPISTVANALGKTVLWDGKRKRVLINTQETIPAASDSTESIELWVNGKIIQSEEQPFFHENRVYVPIRTIAEALGIKIEWSSRSNTVIISSK